MSYDSGNTEYQTFVKKQQDQWGPYYHN
jgi:hypothetical protein